jgi:hypothetical protein
VRELTILILQVITCFITHRYIIPSPIIPSITDYFAESSTFPQIIGMQRKRRPIHFHSDNSTDLLNGLSPNSYMFICTFFLHFLEHALRIYFDFLVF